MSESGFIYLSGGGDEQKTKEIDAFFLDNLPSKSILFIPIGKTGDLNGYKKSAIWLTNKLNDLGKGPVEVFLMTDLKNHPDLREFSAIYIGGGNTYKLLYLMNRAGFLPILREYIGDGGIVYGASAGAVLMGVDISTYLEEKYLLDNEKYGYKLTSGMALLGTYSVLTHFEEADYQKVERYFERKTNPVLAIPGGTAVMVKENIAKVIGSKGVHIFNRGHGAQKIFPGQSFVL